NSIIELPQLEELTIADIAIGDIISILLTVRCPNLKRLGYGASSPPWVLDDFYDEAVTAWNSAPMLDYPLLEHLDIWQLTRSIDLLPIRKLPLNVIHLGLGANTGAKDRVFELKRLLRLFKKEPEEWSDSIRTIQTRGVRTRSLRGVFLGQSLPNVSEISLHYKDVAVLQEEIGLFPGKVVKVWGDGSDGDSWRMESRAERGSHHMGMHQKK
ncbi:hypothetical protein FRC02_006585, partial [Tulasnella sp. 418]